MTVFAEVNGVELSVFLVLFGVVTVLGFVASRWRRAESLDHLDEWGLGGRDFRSRVSWVLIGGGPLTPHTLLPPPAPPFRPRAPRVFPGPVTILIFPLGV